MAKAPRQLQIGPCSVFGCGKPVQTRNWCTAHYNAVRRHGDPAGKPKRQPALCAAEGCDKLAYGKKAYCRAHDARLRRHPGDLTKRARPKTVNIGECKAPDCTRAAEANGYCNAHYKRYRLRGDTAGQRPMLSEQQILTIRANPSGLSNAALAKLMSTYMSTIVAVKRGRAWGFLIDPEVES